ncbi:hypothetical protein ACLM5H_05115 [Fredinandcohnia humi]
MELSLEGINELYCDRFKSVLGIPTKVTRTHIQNIETILEFVEKHQPTNDEFVQFVIDDFRIKKNTAIHVRPTLGRANLILTVNRTNKLTNISRLYLNEPNPRYLAKGFLENYFGFLELILIINNNNIENKKVMFDKWNKLTIEQIGNRPESTQRTQFGRIFKYLEIFKLLHKENDTWKVNNTLLEEALSLDVF